MNIKQRWADSLPDVDECQQKYVGNSDVGRAEEQLREANR